MGFLTKTLMTFLALPLIVGLDEYRWEEDVIRAASACWLVLGLFLIWRMVRGPAY